MSESGAGDSTVDYEDPEWLEEQYHENGLTLREIEELSGVSDTTILRQMERHGIDRRPQGGSERNPYPSPRVNQYGHLELRVRDDGERPSVMMHRLHATLLVDDLAELDGKEIHHKNGCPFDNRLENYELLDPEAHYRITRQLADLLPTKGLCRRCRSVAYLRDGDEIRFCPYCGEEYGPPEIVATEHIDWGGFEFVSR